MSAGLSLPVRGAMKLLLTTLILLMIVSLVLAERNNGHWHGIGNAARLESLPHRVLITVGPRSVIASRRGGAGAEPAGLPR